MADPFGPFRMDMGRIIAASLRAPAAATDGAGAQDVPAPTQAAAGGETIAGTAAQGLAGPTQSASDSQPATGTAAQGIPGPTQAASGQETIALTGAAADGSPVTFSGTATAPAFGGSRQVVFSTDDGTEDNYETLYRDANDDLIFEYRKAGGTIFQCNAGNVGDSEAFDWAIRSDTNDFALVIDGWPPSHNLLGERPVVTTMRLQSDLNGNPWGGTADIPTIYELAQTDAWMEGETANFTETGAIYIDAVDGNDSTGDGSIGSPYKTMDKVHQNAATLVPAGTAIYLKAGQIHGSTTGGVANMTLTVTGTRRQPIIIDRYGTGDNPRVISLGQDIKSSLGAFSASGVTSGLWKRAYAGTTLNGFWEDNVRLTEAADIASITAGTWFWDKAGTDPDNESLGAGLWYMPSSGVPNDHYLARGLDKSSIQLNDVSYAIIRNVSIEQTPAPIWARPSGGTAPHHVVVEDITIIGGQTCVHFGSGTPAPIHHCTVRRIAATGCIIPIIWEANGGADELQWNECYDNDLGQADFNDAITKHIIKRTGSGVGGDHEIISGQNMSHFRCFWNTIDLSLNTTQLTPWGGIVLWVRGTAPLSNMDDVQIARNYVKGLDFIGIVLGAGATDGLTTNGRIWDNIVDDCASGIKTNVNNTTTGSETWVMHNIIHNCPNALHFLYANGTIAKDNLISGTYTYLVNAEAGIGNNILDYNGYEDAGVGTPFYNDTGAVSFADWKTATGEDANSYDTTPTYADGANPTTALGFRQTADSDSLGKGVAVDGIVKDFEHLPFGANLLGAFS